MKKYFIFAAIAAAGLLTSCSSSDDAISDVPGTPTENQNQLVPIQLGIGTITTTEVTRGTGTVGGVGAGDADPRAVTGNKWQGQKVNVFMFQKGSLLLSRAMDPDQPANAYPSPIFNNTELTTPTDATSGVAEEILADGRQKIRYYPIEDNDATDDFDNRKSDFWGYYMDDAYQADAEGDILGVDDADATTVTVPFEIDGSQDLMVAKAELTTAQAAEVAGWAEAQRTNYYSSFAARRGVQPTMEFQHQLTRLTFEFLGGTKETCGWYNDGTTWVNTAEASQGRTFTGVFVKSVNVYSKTTGRLIAAYTPNAELPDNTPNDNNTTGEKIAWGEADDVALSLKSADIDNAGTTAADAVYTWVNSTAAEFAAAEAANQVTLDKDATFPAGALIADNAGKIYKQWLDADSDNEEDAGEVTYKEVVLLYPVQVDAEATKKLKPLYNPTFFPEINPSSANYSKKTANAAWGAALVEGSAHYDEVYALTATGVTDADFDLENNPTPITVGGALLVQPKAGYKIEIELGQYLKDKDNNGTGIGDEYYVRYIPVTLTDTQVTTDGGFQPGYSYNVKVIVYGSERIEVTTALKNWVNGGDKEIDTEDFGY